MQRPELERLFADAADAVKALPAISPEAPHIAYDIGNDTAWLSIQDPVGDPPWVLFYRLEPDVEVQLDGHRAGRILGVMIRSPSALRTPSWYRMLEALLGPALVRHIRTISDPLHPSTMSEYIVHDDALDEDAVAELKVAWLSLDEQARNALGVLESGEQDESAASLVGRLREAIKHRGFKLSAPSWPRLTILPAGGVRSTRSDRSVMTRWIPAATASLLGVEERVAIYPGETGCRIEVTTTQDTISALGIRDPGVGIVPLVPLPEAPAKLQAVLDFTPAAVEIVTAEPILAVDSEESLE